MIIHSYVKLPEGKLCLILHNNGFPLFSNMFPYFPYTGLRNRFFFVLVSVSQAMSPAPTSCLAAGLRGPTATIFDRYSFIAPGSLLVFNDSITRQSWVLTEKNKRKTQSHCVCEFRCALCRVSHGFLQLRMVDISPGSSWKFNGY